MSDEMHVSGGCEALAQRMEAEASALLVQNDGSNLGVLAAIAEGYTRAAALIRQLDGSATAAPDDRLERIRAAYVSGESGKAYDALAREFGDLNEGRDAWAVQLDGRANIGGYWSVEDGRPYWVDDETHAHLSPVSLEPRHPAWSALAEIIWRSRVQLDGSADDR